MTTKRDPFAAMLLSTFSGVGQLYNGQAGKGLLFLSIDLIGSLAFSLSGVVNHFFGLVGLIVFLFSFLIYRMKDGFINAKRLAAYELKRYNHWLVYGSFILLVSMTHYFLGFPIPKETRMFKYPSPAMAPTIQVGDRIVAELNYYDHNAVQQGDIVVFTAPEGDVRAFRIIGMPGDSIDLRESNVYVNGQQNKIKKSKEFFFEDQPVIQYEEQLNPNKKIKMLRYRYPRGPKPPPFKKIRIPDGEYFLMGDNRDDAFDSRYIGTIKRENILGRLAYTYWGTTFSRINIDLRKE